MDIHIGGWKSLSFDTKDKKVRSFNGSRNVTECQSKYTITVSLVTGLVARLSI